MIATAGRDGRDARARAFEAPAANAALVTSVSWEPPGRCVVLGASDPGNSLWLARNGWRVTTVDPSSSALEEIRVAGARERLPMATVADEWSHFLEQGHTFDLVVITDLGGKLETRRALVSLAASVVELGGHLFVTTGDESPSEGDAPESGSLLDDTAGLVVHRSDQRASARGNPGTGNDFMLWATRIERSRSDDFWE